jgi:uncharacterized protein YraI
MSRWRILLGIAALMTLSMVAHPPAILAFLIEVRSGPGAAYEVVATIPAVGSFVAVAQEQDWYKIQLPDGRTGWIHNTALQQEPPARNTALQQEPSARTPPVVAPAPALPSPTTPAAASPLPPSAPPPAVPPTTSKIQTVTAPPTSRSTALVIGNAAYPVGPLQNTVNDATDMAATLRRLGFDVTLLRDAPLQKMEEAVNAFNLRLRQGGMGLFYFAGHGVQVDGENYLLPLNARIERQQDVRYQALPMGRVVGAMEDAGNGLNIVILDACRNMPFTRSWRSSQVGLAPPSTARGMLIAYATAPGGMAADGADRNGVYTKHLLQAMTLPGLSIEQVFKQVRSGVVTETDGRQTPWESSSLLGEVVFVPSPAPTVPAVAPASASSAAVSGPSKVSPPSSSTSAPPQPPIDRAAPPNVSAAAKPGAEAGSNTPKANASPARSAIGYTLIRRIYCEDIGSGAIQSSIDLIATSYRSCAEAQNELLKLERQKDNCRYPKDDPGFVDNTARESPHKVKEWVETASCKNPS